MGQFTSEQEAGYPEGPCPVQFDHGSKITDQQHYEFFWNKGVMGCIFSRDPNFKVQPVAYPFQVYSGETYIIAGEIDYAYAEQALKGTGYRDVRLQNGKTYLYIYFCLPHSSSVGPYKELFTFFMVVPDQETGTPSATVLSHDMLNMKPGKSDTFKTGAVYAAKFLGASYFFHGAFVASERATFYGRTDLMGFNKQPGQIEYKKWPSKTSDILSLNASAGGKLLFNVTVAPSYVRYENAYLELNELAKLNGVALLPPTAPPPQFTQEKWNVLSRRSSSAADSAIYKTEFFNRQNLQFAILNKSEKDSFKIGNHGFAAQIQSSNFVPQLLIFADAVQASLVAPSPSSRD